MNDLISIIVPIYNVEKYLEKCINSIINQSYKNIEIILINDGSTDSCSNICRKYKSLDDRIKVIETENKGVSSARNRGIEISNGKYILFIDSDDWLESNMVEKLYNNILKTNAEISICNYYEVKNNKKYSNNLNIENIFNTQQFLYYVFDERYFKGYLWNKLFSRKCIFNNNKIIKFNKDVHICEDLLFIFQIAQNVTKVCYTDEKLYNYLQRENSALSSGFNMKKASKLIIFKELIDIAAKYNTKLVEKILFEYVWAAMDIKYNMKKYRLLNNDIKKKLNNIRNKNLVYALKSKEHKFSRKIKLVMYSISCYLYGTLKDIKNDAK